MKITTINVAMFCAGAILIYSGIKAYDPRDVVKWGLGGKKPKKMETAKQEEPKVNPDGGNPGDVPRFDDEDDLIA